MYTKLAVVGAAVLGAQAAVATCPLNVEISNVNGHTVDVTITNAGNEDLAVFKGDTVLSDAPTENVKVTTDAGNTIPFSGVFISYDRRNLAADSIESIPAGTSVTKTVNIATTHDLAGVDNIKVAAIQNFNYQPASSTNSNVNKMSSCSTASLDVQVTPDQSTVKRDHLSSRAEPLSRIQKRAVTYSGCSSSRTSTLNTAVSRAITQSTNAINSANSGGAYYTTWFKSTSVLSKVKSIYTSVVNISSKSPTVYCTDYANYCGQNALAYTSPSENRVAICPNAGFWSLPMEEDNCAESDYDQAGIVLHEFTHLFGTEDYAYGRDSCIALSASQASNNADTYELYGASVRLGGCN